MNVADHIRMIQQQQVAPALVERVAENEDIEAVAEVCAKVHVTVQEECQKRGLSKHAGQAACYMVVNELAEDDRRA